MLRKISFTALSLTLIIINISPQNKNNMRADDVIILPGHMDNEIITDEFNAVHISKILGTLDTLSNIKMWSGQQTAIAMYGQDVLMQWFIAPADMIIKAVGYKTTTAAPDGSTLNIRLFKLDDWWNFEKLRSSGDKQWGFFPSAGDGFNEVTPFPNEATGSFQDSSGLSCPGILGTYIWGDNGHGYNSSPVSGQYVWMEMGYYGPEPSVNKGDIIAVLLQNNSSVLQFENNYANSTIQISGNAFPSTVGYNEFKFYENGRFAVDNGEGWWSRKLDLNIILVADLTGDRAPLIKSLTDIPDTIWTSPIDVQAQVVDDNPSGGPQGVSSVYLYFQNETSLDSIPMTSAGGNIFTAQIPGQNFGAVVTYYVKAIDIQGNISLPFGYQYQIKDYNDFYQYLYSNRIKMWVSNNGDGSHNPNTNSSGFYWPMNETDTAQAVYEDGLIWGGYHDGILKVGGSTYNHGMSAGKILPGGIPDDPFSSRCRVYKIKKGWESLPPSPLKESLEKDYNEWPVEDGAPWVDIDGNGIFTRDIDQPEFIGDEVIWYVSNDLDPARTQRVYGSNPIGIEMQVTAFAYDSSNDLADIVFKKYKLINKSSLPLTNTYISYWADPDLGNAQDDLMGSDPFLNLGYTYNVNEYDSKYGSPPPSVGYDLLQGPIVPGEPYQAGLLNGRWRSGYKNLNMTSFTLGISTDPNFTDPPLGIYEGTTRTYYMMQGLDRNGNIIIDPNSGFPTKYCVSGDPINGSGWVDGIYNSPGDRRHYISSGPFNFAPNDTQEVFVAILIDKGTDRLNSITELKNKDGFLQNFYYDHFLTLIPDFEIQCDMSVQIREGAFNPSSDQLKIMAGFNGWNGNIMSDPDNDSVYSFSLHDVKFDSLINFKFWTSPDRWEGGADCRTIEIGNTPGGYIAYFNDDSVYSLPKNIILHYRCNMSIETASGRFIPATGQVKLRGWQYAFWQGVEMANIGSNIYEYVDTLLLGVNDYIPGYKFFYTPDEWEGGNNKTIRIEQSQYDEGEIIIERYFNQEFLGNIDFQCDMTVQIIKGSFDPAAGRVEVRGNFNGWNGTDYELADPDNDWVYSLQVNNFAADSHLVFKYWHSPNNWEANPDREYNAVSGNQVLNDYFNRDDDPSNGDRLWESENSNTTNGLFEVSVINDHEGWAVGDPGIIIHTTNGGQNWMQQTSGTDQRLWSVSFVNQNTGWAAGNGGIILRTTNGGVNWNSYTGVTSEPLREVYFLNENTGWIAGSNGLIMKTTDGGNSWTSQTTNTGLRIQSIFFIDLNKGWACGQEGLILHTSNGGQNWILQNSNTTNYLLDIHFENSNVGWVVGWDGMILKTVNGGNSWTQQNSKLPPGGDRNDFYNVWFTDLYHGWAVGTHGIIRYTSDGGADWVPQYSGTIRDLYGVMFSNNNLGCIVGTNGTVLNYLNQTELEWNINLLISDAGAQSGQLSLGQNLNASDGIDPSLGEEELPPLPPVHAFDTR
ncbi:MAG TPA: YCF48-related protein, partial [Ignavibacteriaceae bacterium]|nr:YCF48-related protein [Ignavibacteriaceae bacterium]